MAIFGKPAKKVQDPKTSARATKRDRDAWATVLRLGRKADVIPPKS